MGWSEKKTDWLGNEYTQHYDDDGNKTGWSEQKTGWLGDEYTQHYDTNDEKSGWSEDRKGIITENYVQHYDNESNKIGWSENKEGIITEHYVQHYDQNDDKSGWSETKRGIIVDRYVQHYDSENSSTNAAVARGGSASSHAAALTGSASASYSAGGSGASTRSSTAGRASGSHSAGAGGFAAFVIFCVVVGSIIAMVVTAGREQQQQPDRAPSGHTLNHVAAAPQQPSQQTVAPPERRSGDPDIAAIQSALARRGFSPGATDGVMSAETAAAIRAFQLSRGERGTGELTSAQREALFMSQVPSGVRVSPTPANPGSVAEFDPIVQAVQRALAARGFDPGPADGLIGPRTRRAIRDFQLSRGEPASDILTPSQQSALIGPAGTAPRSGTGAALPFVGKWIGSVFQIPAGTQQMYPVTMTISDTGGSIDYPSLGCGGTLSVEARSQGVMTLRERITYGRSRCIDQGVVELRIAGDRVEWIWTGSGYIARSSLTRAP